MKTIGFYMSSFSERGTDVAVYDYAYFNETILKNKSIIISYPLEWYSKNNRPFDNDVYIKFRNSFRFYMVNSTQEIQTLPIDVFYTICYGNPEPYSLKFPFKSIKHCVFDTRYSGANGETICCAISQDLNNRWKTNVPVLPHMINLPKTTENLRQALNIPSNSIVFGRYGGFDQFDISFVHQIVWQIAQSNSNYYFIFMNTKRFCPNIKNIIHLDKNVDLIVKRKFINTCDAMLHARQQGETFGLSCGEFSLAKKPIITWSNSPERAHLDILGDKALLYNDSHSLYNVLINFKPNDIENDYLSYTPEYVMSIFNQLI